MAGTVSNANELKPIICCACGQNCGVIAHMESGRVAALTGDKAHPGSKGFICIKGTDAPKLLNRPDRVNWPLKRAGRRGEGKWERIGWDQALDEIAAKVKDLADRHGPETVATTTGTIHGSDFGMSDRFLNLLGSPNLVSQDKICTGPLAVGETITFGLGPSGYGPPAAGVTKCVVLWGMHPSASKPLAWSAVVAARRAGSKLIVVDPMRSSEARQADIFVQHRPGTDAALALGWLNVIISERLYDHEFVAASTVGFEALKERAAEYPPSRVAEITWVPEETIIAAARMYATSNPAMLTPSNGVCQIGIGAVQASRAIACLIAITGNLGRAGGNHIYGPPRKIIGNGTAMLADKLSQEQRDKRIGADHFALINGDSYRMLDDAVARRWYGQHNILSVFSSGHEPMLWTAILDRTPYPVTALFVQYRNPLGGASNSGRVGEALKSPNLELLVVHDLFKSPTAEYADYVLPAADWLEKPFFSLGTAYIGMRGDYAEANHAASAPAYERRSDYQLWRDLGRRLGQADQWPERIEELWEQWLAATGISFDELAIRCGPWMDAPAHHESDRDLPAYGTPSGQIELKSSLLEKWGIEPTPHHEESAIFRDHRVEYPLVLTTGGRQIEGFHQNAVQSAAYRRKFPDPVVQIHPETAAALGIGEGDWVAIETPVGRVSQRARISDLFDRRVIHGERWWYPERNGAEPEVHGIFDTNINVCTDDDLAGCDPIMGAWPLRAVPARIVPSACGGHAGSNKTPSDRTDNDQTDSVQTDSDQNRSDRGIA